MFVDQRVHRIEGLEVTDLLFLKLTLLEILIWWKSMVWCGVVSLLLGVGIILSRHAPDLGL